MIRLVNDFPYGLNYFEHTVRFIIIELIGVITGSYICFYLAKKWIKYTFDRHINFLLEYGIVILLPCLLALFIMGMSHESSLNEELPKLIIPLTITSLMSIWLYLIQKNDFLEKLYTQAIIREQEARNAESKAELKFLRSQFHPHFLFNMLNTIYFNIDENNENARCAIEHLSNLLRSQLYENDGPVKVEREISAIESYIEMNKLRFGDTININSSIDSGFEMFIIHPHLLFPLIENAFKHSGGDPWKIKISIKRISDTLILDIVNSIPHYPTNHITESGIGLKNLIRRLELLYPGHHRYETSITDRLYSVHLEIELNFTSGMVIK